MPDLARSFPAPHPRHWWWRYRCPAAQCSDRRWTRWGYRRHYAREHPTVLHYHRVFAFQDAARRLGGRHIGTGGMRPGPFYGFVAATYPEGSRRAANPDAWRCHHSHQAELDAFACALAEVRRLAGGGEPVVCSDWPYCGRPEDIRYAAEAGAR